MIKEILQKLNIKYEEVEHKPVFTSLEAQFIKEKIKGVGVKNLFIKDSKNFYIVLQVDDKKANLKEIQNTFVKENINDINSVGFPVWYEKKNGNFENVYFDNKSPHFLLIGSTGSGKSVTVVIPECIMFATAKEKHSVVVTDPKGEIFKSTSKIFKDNGYDVITIDFRNPNKSNKINIKM